MDAFTVRDLRERTGELIRDAEEGKLSLVTKHGQPVFVAVPFDERLVQHGILVALAIRLFEEEVVSVAQASKVAGVAEEQFLENLAAAGVPAARYDAGELDDELSAFKLQQKPTRYRVRKAKR
jgi:prevent-host-death family protein